MDETRDEVVSLKTSRSIKARLKLAAKGQRRTVSNMLECAILEWFETKGIPEPTPEEIARLLGEPDRD